MCFAFLLSRIRVALGGLIRIYNNEKNTRTSILILRFSDFNMQRPGGSIIDFLQGNFLSADATIILLLGELRDQHFCNKIICFLPKKRRKMYKRK